MGELTSEAASKPPLPPRSPGSQYFPCHFIDTSQSGEETPPDQFPRVWVMNLWNWKAVCFSSLLHFTLSSFPPLLFFPSCVQAFFPPSTEGQRDNRVLWNIRRNTSTRDDVLFLPVSIFNFLDVQRGGKIALFVSEQFGQSIYRVWKYFGYRVWGRCSSNFYHEK